MTFSLKGLKTINLQTTNTSQHVEFFHSLIFQKVRQSRKMFENKESSVECKSEGLNSTNHKRQKAMESVENQLTIMLLLVTTLFVILMIPVQIRILYLLFVTIETPFSCTV